MQRVLVTGATGYVGGRLVPLLLGKGYRVRVFARSVRKVASRPWGRHENLEIVQGDMLNLASIQSALKGCHFVYYLVHSMEAGQRDFSNADRHAAYNMVRALKGASVKRLIYLSGLLPNDPDLSAHLRSRGEVEEILALADTPVTTLRAAQLVGSGSASFEMIRWLVDRLPIMITPRWTNVRTQPIAITDALTYLAGVLENPETAGRSFDIGGPDILSYADLFGLYAEAAGLRRRLLIPFPWMRLNFSAWLVGLITPIPSALALPLIKGMRNEVICRDNSIRSLVPFELTPIKTAIERALGHVRGNTVSSSWSDAGLHVAPEWVQRGDAQFAGSVVFKDGYLMRFAASPAEVWKPIVQIGGSQGWYSNRFLWRARGLMDRCMGGPGTLRGRRSNDNLYVGDGLDFWRVLNICPEKRLLLLSEMRLPGEGLLDLRLNPRGPIQGDRGPETELLICLYFRPSGVPGRLYWYAVSPFHSLVFKSMLRSIARHIARPAIFGPVRTTLPLTDLPIV